MYLNVYHDANSRALASAVMFYCGKEEQRVFGLEDKGLTFK